MSYMSVDGERSATQHAGIPAIINVPVEATTAGSVQVVVPDQPAQKIKVLSYSLTPSAANGAFLWGTSGTTSATLTGIMGGIAGTPTTMPLNFPFSYFTTRAGESLVVSSTLGIQGNVVFQRTY